MKSQKLTLYLHEVEIAGHQVNATLAVTIADQGIGFYEYWGAKGIDSHMGVDEIQIVTAEFVEPTSEDLTQVSAKTWLEMDSHQDELYDAAEDSWTEYESRQERDYPEEDWP